MISYIIGIVVLILVVLIAYMKHLRYLIAKTRKYLEFEKGFSPKQYDANNYYIPAKELLNYKSEIESSDFRYLMVSDDVLCYSDVSKPTNLVQKKINPLGWFSLKNYADIAIAKELTKTGNMKLRYDFGKPIVSNNEFLNNYVEKMKRSKQRKEEMNY